MVLVASGVLKCFLGGLLAPALPFIYQRFRVCRETAVQANAPYGSSVARLRLVRAAPARRG